MTATKPQPTDIDRLRATLVTSDPALDRHIGAIAYRFGKRVRLVAVQRINTLHEKVGFTVIAREQDMEYDAVADQVTTLRTTHAVTRAASPSELHIVEKGLKGQARRDAERAARIASLRQAGAVTGSPIFTARCASALKRLQAR